MNMIFSEFDLLRATQNRAKIYSWSQLWQLTQKLPTQITSTKITRDNKYVDPSWLYTQSGKNYLPDYYLKWYTDQSLQHPIADNYGFSNRLAGLTSKPFFASQIYNDFWFQKQLSILKISNLLYLAPGIKKIYLVGSVAQQIASRESDVDLAIECYRGWVLPARMYLKLLLKMSQLDVHSFWLELWLYIDKHFRHGGNQSKIRDRIWHFKSRTGLKIDAGLFFQNSTQIYTYFENSVRNLSILDLHYLPNRDNYNHHSILENQNTCYIPNSNFLPRYLVDLVRWLLYIPGIVLYPISLMQILWFDLKHTEQDQLSLKFDFCCFFPRYPLASYLTKLESK